MKKIHIQKTMCRPILSFSVCNGLSTPIDLLHPKFLNYIDTYVDEKSGDLHMSYLSESYYQGKEMVLILNEEPKRTIIESTFIEPVFGVSYFPVKTESCFNICIDPLTAIDVFCLYIHYLQTDRTFVDDISAQREAIYNGNLSFDFDLFNNDSQIFEEFKQELEELIPDLFDITHFIKEKIRD